MAGKLNRWQVVGPFKWKGLTDTNALGAMFMKKPQLATQTMVQLMAYKYGNTLDTLLSQFPTKTFESSDEYTWKVIGGSRRNIPLVEARNESGTVITTSDVATMYGANQQPFYLVFAEDWFWRGATIVGNLNEIYQFVIMDEPKFEGTNCIYKVYLSGGNTDGIPGERLLPGERFSVEASYVEDEGSREVGDIHFATPTEMRNEFSTVRIKHKVWGKQLEDKLAIGLPIIDDKGNKQVMTTWMHYVDFQFEREFNEQKNNALAFGRSNRNENGEYMDFGTSGHAIKKSAGLFEQMEVGNTIYHNQFSLRLLNRSLLDLFSGKTDYSDRTVILRTGDAGAMDFNQAVLQETAGWTPLQIDNSSVGAIRKTSSPYHSNSLTAGMQFTEFEGPMGIRVKLQVDPSYNDPVRNKIKMPDGTLAYSHRMDIMDIGTMDQPNVFKVASAALPERRGYQWGMVNPFTGQTSNNNMSWDEDSCVIHKMATLGICVLDPTRTMSLIPNVLQG